MDVTGLVVVLLLAQTTAILAASREYRFINQPKTWTQAQIYCRENFVDLATIETQEDWAKVAGMMSNSAESYAWIGLYDDVNTWRWSLDNTSFYDSVYSFLSLNANNLNGKQYCAVLSANGLDDLPCSDTEPSLCYDEPSNTYIAVTTPMTWHAARSHCRQVHTDLAIVRNQGELQTARSVIGSGSSWVGLFRESWKWSDQTNLSFSNWETDQPDEANDCGAASVNGWSDSDCTIQRPFICSVPIRKVLQVEVKTNGNVNLNDPLVQAAILRQVEKDMRARGIKQDFKLIWRNQPTGNVFK